MVILWWSWIWKSGRKNQIRVHMSELGHPVIGDERYGSECNPLGPIGTTCFQTLFLSSHNRGTDAV